MAHPLDEQVEAIVRLVQPTAQTDASRSEVFQYVCRLIEASQLGAKVRNSPRPCVQRDGSGTDRVNLYLSPTTSPNLSRITQRIKLFLNVVAPGVLVWIGSAQDVFARRRH
jgi:hypothetical protein